MTGKKNRKNPPEEAQTTLFEVIMPLVSSLHAETRELSKKKPEGTMNPLKVKMINRVLEQAREVLRGQPSAAFLDLLDDEALPQNSDAMLILGQYDAALDSFKKSFFGWDGIAHRWVTVENPSRGDRLFD